jgi:hypothetical protein
MDPIDDELRRSLNNWAAKQTPPSNGRARLLGTASLPSKRPERPAQFQISALPTEVFSLAMIYSMQKRTTALRIVS